MSLTCCYGEVIRVTRVGKSAVALKNNLLVSLQWEECITFEEKILGFKEETLHLQLPTQGDQGSLLCIEGENVSTRPDI